VRIIQKPVLTLLVILSSLAVTSTAVAQQSSLSRPVKVYPIDCQDTFACPESLMPRVGFWIEVFSRWDTDTAIFHDKNTPQRVFSTLKRNEGCRRSKKGGPIERERKRLKRNLQNLASKLKSGQALNSAQTRLYASFNGASANEVQRASERIRCQSGNRDRMREALEQFHLYRPTILDALEKENLTPELQYLPFVESAFNPNALSHVGAAGLWQIMPSTGRRLGLVVDNRIDERYDPRSATYAAAKYFRGSVDDLSETAFENGHSISAENLNPFVITSYNYGVRGMQRAIKQVGLDYERLLKEYKSPNFQTAVKNFYASFLAARYVAKNSAEFFDGLNLNPDRVVSSTNRIVLKRATSAKRLANNLNLSQADLKTLNPAFKRVIWKHQALIPKGAEVQLPFQESGWTAEFDKIYNLPREIEKPGFVWHRVKRGESACGIAERYRASCRALIRLNNLNKRATIFAGKRIKVPSKTGGISVAKQGDSPSLGSRSAGQTADSASFQNYRVRRGDSSCLIANRYGMRCGEFLAVNGLQRGSVIRVGQLVRVSSSNSWHTVRRGQTACGIAESYRVRCSALLDANQLRRNSKIYVGQRLRIPKVNS